MRQRRELARAADLPCHVAQVSRDLLRFELVGHRPARELVGIAQRAPRFIIADIDHSAVDHVVEIAARLLNLPNRRDHALDVVRPQLAFGHRKVILAQKIQHFAVICECAPLYVIHAVHARRQLSGRSDFRIEIAQRAGRGVARVLERLCGGLVVGLQRA